MCQQAVAIITAIQFIVILPIHMISMFALFLKMNQAYHRGAVLKDEFPEKTNCIFGFSMVDNLRRR